MILLSGGRGGIRTPDGLAPITVFKTAAFNRSATLPLPAFVGADLTKAQLARLIYSKFHRSASVSLLLGPAFSNPGKAPDALY